MTKIADPQIRRLTPLECERLQAYPDNWTELGVGDEPISDTQRYKMCGNGVTVNVVEAVMRELFNNCKLIVEAMTNTPNPQANTLDEILRPWLEEAQSEYGTGHNDHKKRAFIEIETAKQQIQALITEARIDEVKRIDPTSDYVLNDLVMSVGDRLTQLKENK